MARNLEDQELHVKSSSRQGGSGAAGVDEAEDAGTETDLNRPGIGAKGAGDVEEEDDDDLVEEDDLDDEEDEDEEDDLEEEEDEEGVDEDEDDLDEEDDEEDEEISRQSAALAASTEEEVDALRVNLEQDGDRGFKRDSTGQINDDVSREELARFTEVGDELEDRGARSVVPGRDDTSETLRRRHPNTTVARSEDIVEGNLDEPRDEIRSESKVDEGTAA